MPDDSETFKQVIVRMPEWLHEELKLQAEAERRTLAEVLREASRRYLAAERETL